VESSYELSNEPSGSIKCWELLRGCTSCGLSSVTQLHRVSQLVVVLNAVIVRVPTVHLLSWLDCSTCGYRRNGCRHLCWRRRRLYANVSLNCREHVMETVTTVLRSIAGGHRASPYAHSSRSVLGPTQSPVRWIWRLFLGWEVEADKPSR
jgi:hypothetical protein